MEAGGILNSRDVVDSRQGCPRLIQFVQLMQICVRDGGSRPLALPQARCIIRPILVVGIWGVARGGQKSPRREVQTDGTVCHRSLDVSEISQRVLDPSLAGSLPVTLLWLRTIVEFNGMAHPGCGAFDHLPVQVSQIDHERLTILNLARVLLPDRCDFLGRYNSVSRLKHNMDVTSVRRFCVSFSLDL